MLTSTPTTTPSQTSLANPRQIAVSSNSAAVAYTVPAGKKFVGYIYGGTVVSAYNITPAGGVATLQRTGTVQATSIATTPFQIILFAGTIITGLGTELYILGIESDL